jgi:hypothetical protein
MLWNPDMNFPNVERAEQLMAKEAKKASNPFAAVAKRKEEEITHQQSAKDDATITVMWNPVIPESSVPLADSSASMAAKGSSMGRALHQAQMLLL